MVAKELNSISKQDIEALVSNEVPESRTLDYKVALPGNSSEEKREFLIDVASFANASGGDILFGVKERRDDAGKPTGVPEAASGLAGINTDAEILRLESMLRDSIEPRVPLVRMRSIGGFPDGPLLIVRVGQSWSPPHMVRGSGAGTYRFYSRNSAGKYPLDSTEIRAAFALSEALPERMRKFRDERLARIIAGETPVELAQNSKVVLHLVPASSMRPDSTIDLGAVASSQLKLIAPMNVYQGNRRYNLDGFICFSRSDGLACESYAQFFRSGAVEAVEASMLNSTVEPTFIPSATLEDSVIMGVTRYWVLLQSLGIEPPIVVFLSLLGIKNRKVAGPRGVPRPFEGIAPIERDAVILPEVLIEKVTNDPYEVARALRPAFDTIWQASGWDGSKHYDQNGKWTRNPHEF